MNQSYAKITVVTLSFVFIVFCVHDMGKIDTTVLSLILIGSIFVFLFTQRKKKIEKKENQRCPLPVLTEYDRALRRKSRIARFGAWFGNAEEFLFVNKYAQDVLDEMKRNEITQNVKYDDLIMMNENLNSRKNTILNPQIGEYNHAMYVNGDALGDFSALSPEDQEELKSDAHWMIFVNRNHYNFILPGAASNKTDETSGDGNCFFYAFFGLSVINEATLKEFRRLLSERWASHVKSFSHDADRLTAASSH